MRHCIALLLVSLLAVPCLAQAPLFETRAVWFTTVLRLDGWPEPGASPAAQEADLRDRIRQAHALGINTFIFQAVARGDALYPSARLPWSHLPKGAGEEPGYDPLAVAIEEAHALGMELHTWINTFRVGDGSTRALFQNVTGPAHVGVAHPEWVVEDDGDLWLDPSSDAARAWLVENVLEVVRAYNVDAVHFDFIRYPEGGLPDDGTRFQADPDNSQYASIGDWRRDNVTQFVRDVYAAIQADKPWVKIGATPIGHYHNAYPWGALSGFFDVFQDSRRWLQDGLADYLAPQIYWDIATAPRFDVLAREWVIESAHRPIFAGLGVYKPEVQAEVGAEIDTTRAAGAAGHVFFRYQHLLQVASTVQARYPAPALPASMLHRFEASAPAMPADLAAIAEVDASGAAVVTLTWAPSAGSSADPLGRYVLFRRIGGPPDPSRPEDLWRVVDRQATSATDLFTDFPEQPVFYTVVALSRLGVLSDAPAAVAAATRPTATDETAPLPALRLGVIHPNPTPRDATVVVDVEQAVALTLAVYDVRGRRVAVVAEGRHGPGRYQIDLDGAAWPSGTYFCVLEADDRRQVRAFTVAR